MEEEKNAFAFARLIKENPYRVFQPVIAWKVVVEGVCDGRRVVCSAWRGCYLKEDEWMLAGNPTPILHTTMDRVRYRAGWHVFRDYEDAIRDTHEDPYGWRQGLECTIRVAKVLITDVHTLGVMKPHDSEHGIMLVASWMYLYPLFTTGTVWDTLSLHRNKP